MLPLHFLACFNSCYYTAETKSKGTSATVNASVQEDHADAGCEYSDPFDSFWYTKDRSCSSYTP
jgi:hypothetical protein